MNNYYNQDYVMEYMKAANLPMDYYPMATMPAQQLESMYPKTCKIIQPVAERTCDKMEERYGPNFIPSQEQLETMIEDVYSKVEEDVYDAVKQKAYGRERQFLGGGRRILRDFIATLLIASLNRRRRRPFFGYPGYGGYGSSYGGYGGYGGFYPYGGFPGY